MPLPSPAHTGRGPAEVDVPGGRSNETPEPDRPARPSTTSDDGPILRSAPLLPDAPPADTTDVNASASHKPAHASIEDPQRYTIRHDEDSEGTRHETPVPKAPSSRSDASLERPRPDRPDTPQEQPDHRPHGVGVEFTHLPDHFPGTLRDNILEGVARGHRSNQGVVQALDVLLDHANLIKLLPQLLDGGTEVILPVTGKWFDNTVYQLRVTAHAGAWRDDTPLRYLPPPNTRPIDAKGYGRVATVKPNLPSKDNFVVATNAALLDLSFSFIRTVNEMISTTVNVSAKVFGGADIARNMEKPVGEYKTEVKLTDTAQTKVAEVRWDVVVSVGNQERHRSHDLTATVTAELTPIAQNGNALNRRPAAARDPLEVTGLNEFRAAALRELHTRPGPTGTAHATISSFLSPATLINNYSHLRHSGLLSDEFTHPEGGSARLELRVKEGQSTYAGAVAYSRKSVHSNGKEEVGGHIGIKQVISAGLGVGATGHIAGPMKGYDPNDPAATERPNTGPVSLSGVLSTSFTPTVLEEKWKIANNFKGFSAKHASTGSLYTTDVTYDLHLWHNNAWQRLDLPGNGTVTEVQPHSVNPVPVATTSIDGSSQDIPTIEPETQRPEPPLTTQLGTDPRIVLVEMPGSVDLRDAIAQRFPDVLPLRNSYDTISQKGIADRTLIEAAVSPSGLKANARPILSSRGLALPLSSGRDLVIKAIPLEDSTHEGASQLTAEMTDSYKFHEESKRLNEVKYGGDVSVKGGLGNPENTITGAASAGGGYAQAKVIVSTTLDGVDVETKLESSGQAERYSYGMRYEISMVPRGSAGQVPEPRVEPDVERAGGAGPHAVLPSERLHVEVLNPQDLPISQNTSLTLPDHYMLEYLNEGSFDEIRRHLIRSAEDVLRRPDVVARQLERNVMATLQAGQDNDISASLELAASDSQLKDAIGRSINKHYLSLASSIVPENRKQTAIRFTMHTEVRNLTPLPKGYLAGKLQTTHTSSNGIIAYDQKSKWLNAGIGGDVGGNPPANSYTARGGAKVNGTLQLDDAEITKETAVKNATLGYEGDLRQYQAEFVTTVSPEIVSQHGQIFHGAPATFTTPGRVLIPESAGFEPSAAQSAEQAISMTGPHAHEFLRRIAGADVFPVLGGNEAIIQAINDTLGGRPRPNRDADPSPYVPEVGLAFAHVYHPDMLNQRVPELLETSGITHNVVTSGALKRTTTMLNLRAEVVSLKEIGSDRQRIVTGGTGDKISEANKNQYKTIRGLEGTFTQGGQPGAQPRANATTVSVAHTRERAEEVGNEAGLLQTKERKTTSSDSTVVMEGVMALTLTKSVRDGFTYTRDPDATTNITDVPFRIYAPSSLVRTMHTEAWPDAAPASPGSGGNKPDRSRPVEGSGRAHIDEHEMRPLQPGPNPWQTSLATAHELVGFIPSGNERHHSLHSAAADLYDRPTPVGRFIQARLSNNMRDTVRSFYVDVGLPDDNPLKMAQKIPVDMRHLSRALTVPFMRLYFDEMRTGAGRVVPGTDGFRLRMVPVGEAERIGHQDTTGEETSASLEAVADPHILKGAKYGTTPSIGSGANDGALFKNNISQKGPTITNERLHFSGESVNLTQGATRNPITITGLPENRTATQPGRSKTTGTIYMARQPVEVITEKGSRTNTVRGWVVYRTNEQDLKTAAGTRPEADAQEQPRGIETSPSSSDAASRHPDRSDNHAPALTPPPAVPGDPAQGFPPMGHVEKSPSLVPEHTIDIAFTNVERGRQPAISPGQEEILNNFAARVASTLNTAYTEGKPLRDIVFTGQAAAPDNQPVSVKPHFGTTLPLERAMRDTFIPALEEHLTGLGSGLRLEDLKINYSSFQQQGQVGDTNAVASKPPAHHHVTINLGDERRAPVPREGDATSSDQGIFEYYPGALPESHGGEVTPSISVTAYLEQNADTGRSGLQAGGDSPVPPPQAMADARAILEKVLGKSKGTSRPSFDKEAAIFSIASTLLKATNPAAAEAEATSIVSGNPPRIPRPTTARPKQ